MEYIRVKFNPIELKVIQYISRCLCELMKISSLVMKGIIWHALHEWQMKNDISISEISNVPLSKRIIVAKEIFSIGKKELKNMLNEPKEKNEILLDIIFEKAFKYYMGFFNKKRELFSFC